MYIEKENEVCPQMNTDGHGCPQADEVVNSNYQQLDSNYHKNILVEEREFMRMERDCEADELL